MNNTKPVETPEALSFFQESQRTMGYLYARWQDEKEYEDIKDYSKPLEGLAKTPGVNILRMTKKPFGCDFPAIR
jgi:hypothetical protein